MQSVQKCFSVLGNKLRADILSALKKGPMPVNRLSLETGADRSNVSHSLSILKECGFVETEKRGRERVYSLSNCIVNDMRVTGNIIESMQYHIRHHCRGRCEK